MDVQCLPNKGYPASVRGTNEWDVAIVGAGPAGLAAASASALGGARTVVLERGVHPRYKTCGGGLIGTSLAAVHGIQVPVREEVHAATFTLDGRREFTRNCDLPVLAMVLRDEFDDALRRQAETDGAVILQHSVVRAISQDESRAYARLAGGTSISAKVLIGADGSSGICAKHVGVAVRQVDLGLEVELIAPGPVSEAWRGRVLLDWGPIPGSYAWIFPKGDRLTVGVIAERGRGDETRRYLDTVLGRHGLSNLERLQSSGHLTRCRTSDSPLRRSRVLVAGDAAGLLEPWTREGISFALRSGKLAGKIAAKASRASASQDSDNILQRYARSLDQDLVPEMRAGELLLAAFKRHPGLFHISVASPEGWRVFAEFCRGESSFASVMERHPSAHLATYLVTRL